MTGLDLPHRYDPDRVFLADVDGDGCADVVFVDDGRVEIFVNESGNRFADVEIRGTPGATSLDAVRIIDLYGQGVPGILWHQPAIGFRGPRMWYLDLCGGTKPYLLDEVNNNMGALTRVTYRSSTTDYVRDDEPGTRWKTPLPFPVLVVGKTESIDQVSGGKLTTEYAYHHGYWDGRDREFRGFARVDARDTEVFDDYHAGTGFEPVSVTSFSPPQETRSWFHVGPVGDPWTAWEELDLSDEYWSGDGSLLENVRAALPADYGDRREAIRTMRGSILRTELYALDGSPRENRPYSVTEAIFGARKEQDAYDGSSGGAADPNGWAIFFPHALATRTTEWDRGDDPMTAFTFRATLAAGELTGDYDAHGMPTRQTAIAVPRGRHPVMGTGSAESYLCTHTETTYAATADPSAHPLLADRASNVVTYEVGDDGGLNAPSVFELKEAIDDETATRAVIGHTLNYYDGEAYTGLPLGDLGSFGALTRSESLVLTDALLAEAYPDGTEAPDVDPAPQWLTSDTPTWGGEYPSGFQSNVPSRGGYVAHAAVQDVTDGSSERRMSSTHFSCLWQKPVSIIRAPEFRYTSPAAPDDGLLEFTFGRADSGSDSQIEP